MAEVVPYGVYLLGPLILAALVARFVPRAGAWALALGFPTFLVAWVGSVTVMSIATAAGVAQDSIAMALIISAAAGLFEESARYLAFRFLPPLRDRRDWPNGVMYAVGHSGMESVIVAGSLVLTAAVVTHAPGLLSEELLKGSQAALDVSTWRKLYDAVERVSVGFVIHAAWTAVVLLSFRKSRWFLLLAMLWHFGHDMVALNLHRVSTHWSVHAIWIAFILVVYGAVLVRLRAPLRARPPSGGRQTDTPQRPAR